MTDKFRVLVCGSRDYADQFNVYAVLDQMFAAEGSKLVIVHGKCPRGADAYAGMWCSKMDVEQETYPANWDSFGKSAGFKRNQEMIDTKPDLVLAFHNGRSAGTADTIRKAKKAGIPVTVYR